MKHLAVLLITILAASFQTYAQGPDHGTPIQQAQSFLDSFKKGSADNAVQEMLERNPFVDKANVVKTVQVVQTLQKSLRLFLDWELILDEKLTKRFNQLTYAINFERQTVIAEFRFHLMAEKTWVINSWNFVANNDQVIAKLRQAKAIKRQKESADHLRRLK